MHIIMTQLSMKAGMKHWVECWTGAVSKELQQLHHCNTFEPVDPKMMTSEDFQEALELHLFLKQKHDNFIKGRMVTDGSKQCTSITKEDATSPTVAIESVLLMATIDAAEGRDVITINIPNAFIQTRLDDDSNKVIMWLHGKLAKLMVEVAPEIYSKYVSVDLKGELVLYVHLLNALYGIMKAALLYYEHFVCNITAIGFKLNPYDPCVANKIVCRQAAYHHVAYWWFESKPQEIPGCIPYGQVVESKIWTDFWWWFWCDDDWWLLAGRSMTTSVCNWISLHLEKSR